MTPTLERWFCWVCRRAMTVQRGVGAGATGYCLVLTLDVPFPGTNGFSKLQKKVKVHCHDECYDVVSDGLHALWRERARAAGLLADA